KPTPLHGHNLSRYLAGSFVAVQRRGLTQVLGLKNNFEIEMATTRRLTPRKALMFFTFALVGSLTGTLVGPRIVGAFDGSPVWLLPGILCVLILLALIVAYMAF